MECVEPIAGKVVIINKLVRGEGTGTYELWNISRCKKKGTEISTKDKRIFLGLCLKKKPQVPGLDFFHCLPGRRIFPSFYPSKVV